MTRRWFAERARPRRRVRRSLHPSQVPTDPSVRYSVLCAHAEETGLEHDHQAAFVAWIDWLVSIGLVPDLRWGYAVGNGGLRHPLVAADLRLEGVRPGVPDWILFVPRGSYAGLVMEFKAPRATVARVTPEQRAWLAHFRSVGCSTHVVFGLHAAQHVTARYFDELPFPSSGANLTRQFEVEFDAWRPARPRRPQRSTGRTNTEGGTSCVA